MGFLADRISFVGESIGTFACSEVTNILFLASHKQPSLHQDSQPPKPSAATWRQSFLPQRNVPLSKKYDIQIYTSAFRFASRIRKSVDYVYHRNSWEHGRNSKEKESSYRIKRKRSQKKQSSYSCMYSTLIFLPTHEESQNWSRHFDRSILTRTSVMLTWIFGWVYRYSWPLA